MVKSSFFTRFQDWLSEWDDSKTRQILVVVLAVLVGLLVGLIIDTAMRLLGNAMFPPPPLFDLAEKEQLARLYETMATEAFSIKILSWAIGTLAGGYTAVRIAKLGQFPAWMVGILLFAAYLIGMIGLPIPTWVVVICPILVAGCAYGAGWLGMYVTVQKEIKAQA